jgi:hypothetical protein
MNAFEVSLDFPRARTALCLNDSSRVALLPSISAAAANRWQACFGSVSMLIAST